MSRSYKYVPREGTVSSISDAFSELETLGEECREIVDNAEGGLAETQRIQTFGDTADTLEGLSEPEVPEVLADVPISYSEAVPARKRMSTSRARRCENAVSVLQAALSAAEEWLENEDNEEHEDRDDVESFKDELENAISDAEGCEFPGMFG